jgi:hypothetical protein
LLATTEYYSIDAPAAGANALWCIHHGATIVDVAAQCAGARGRWELARLLEAVREPETA